jgi:hypothetical protein
MSHLGAGAIGRPAWRMARRVQRRLIRAAEAYQYKSSRSGASGEATPMNLGPIRACSDCFYGGFKLGRLANNNRIAALQ